MRHWSRAEDERLDIVEMSKCRNLVVKCLMSIINITSKPMSKSVEMSNSETKLDGREHRKISTHFDRFRHLAQLAKCKLSQTFNHKISTFRQFQLFEASKRERKQSVSEKRNQPPQKVVSALIEDPDDPNNPFHTFYTVPGRRTDADRLQGLSRRNQQLLRLAAQAAEQSYRRGVQQESPWPWTSPSKEKSATST